MPGATGDSKKHNRECGGTDSEAPDALLARCGALDYGGRRRGGGPPVLRYTFKGPHDDADVEMKEKEEILIIHIFCI